MPQVESVEGVGWPKVHGISQRPLYEGRWSTVESIVEIQPVQCEAFYEFPIGGFIAAIMEHAVPFAETVGSITELTIVIKLTYVHVRHISHKVKPVNPSDLRRSNYSEKPT